MSSPTSLSDSSKEETLQNVWDCDADKNIVPNPNDFFRPSMVFVDD